jgi:aerobic C4-dicarboxylate transport protein
MRGFVRILFGQAVAALVVGIPLGQQHRRAAEASKTLGEGVMKLIKMVITPLVFGVTVHGVVGAGDLRKVGRVRLKAITCFTVVATIAPMIGVVLANAMEPGCRVNIDVKRLEASPLSAYTSRIAPRRMTS